MQVKRWSTIGIVATIATSLIACSSNTKKPEQGTGASSPSASQAPSAAATPDANKKFTVTSMQFVWGNVPPQDGKGIQMINEKFNIDYKPNLVAVGDYFPKLSATIASGEIPDIIVIEGADSSFYKWAKQGAFLSINEYIDQYPTLKAVPKNIWKTFTLSGKTYAMPRYAPLNYTNTAVIRKDWLDKLNLQVPTTYEELRKVALAFTNDDPDGNGKKDTYGIAMGQNISPSYAMGAYWDQFAYYHKNAEGQYTPGIVSQGRKELVGWLADLYKQGAITKDFALINSTQANKEFYSGKAGIFMGNPNGMSEQYMQSLIDINPNAKVVPLPPFKAPDGSQGFTSSSGFYGLVALNAKLANDPAKLKRILEMIDFGRTFYPQDQRNPNNKNFDWERGLNGQGYTVADGTVQYQPADKGFAPANYIPDANMWAPSDESNGYSNSYKVPQLREYAAAAEKMHAGTKHYFNPVNAVTSATQASKGSELEAKLIETQTKMIVGDVPISDWDKMVKTYMDNGGTQIVKEINDALKEQNIQGSWE